MNWKSLLRPANASRPIPRPPGPVDALIMAGGRGKRLRPMTDDSPKPLLPVGDRPIIDWMVQRLMLAGIRRLFVSVGYKSEAVKQHFLSHAPAELIVEFIEEAAPMGTLWAARNVPPTEASDLLVVNADILTDLDFSAFIRHYFEKGCDVQVATRPFEIHVPYAVMDLAGETVLGLEEKPTLRYFHNAGIYLFRKELASLIPEQTPCDAPDFVQNLIHEGASVMQYPILGYWMDVGRPGDFEKAQDDIQYLQF